MAARPAQQRKRRGASKQQQQQFIQRRKRRGLAVESLEPRQMLAATVSATVQRVALISDTGSSDTDLVTANLAISGSVTGKFVGRTVRVDFDHNGDQMPDGRITVDKSGAAFTYDPRHFDSSLYQYSGPLTLHYRPVVVDASGNDEWIGRWSKLSLQSELPPLLQHTIDDLQLANDTGQSTSDRLTWDPTIVGSAAFAAPTAAAELVATDEATFLAAPRAGIARFSVEWDTDADHEPDHRTLIDGSGRITFRPAGLQYGKHTVQARIVLWDVHYGAPRYSDWQAFSFDFVAQPTAKPQQLRLANDDGVPGDLVTTDPRVWGRVPTLSAAPVYVDLNGDEIADDIRWTDEGGAFSYRPPSPAAGEIRLGLRTSRWDVIAQADVFSDWTSFVFTYAPAAPPAVSSLFLSSADSISGWTGPVLSGKLAQPSTSALVEFDDDGDGVVDNSIEPQADGQFMRPILLTSGSTTTIAARTRHWDSADHAVRYSDWTSFAITVPAASGAHDVSFQLSLAQDTGQLADDRQTTNGTVLGRLNNPPARRFIWAEIDRNGDRQADATIAADGAGEFRYLPDSAIGAIELHVRAMSWDEERAAVVAGPWQTFAYEVVEPRPAVREVQRLSLIMDTGEPDDARTTIPWFEGQLDPAAAAAFVEIDYDQDGWANAFELADANGRFRHRPIDLARGANTISVRAGMWISGEARYEFGPWSMLNFTYESQPDALPSVLSAAFTMGNSANAFSAAAVTGLVAAVEKFTVAEVQLDVDSDGLVDAAAPVDDWGQYAVPLPILADGEHSIQLRTVARALEGDESPPRAGQWQLFRITTSSTLPASLPPPLSTQPHIVELSLQNDTGLQSNDRSTADPRIAGRADIGNATIDIDQNADGTIDARVAADKDGRFTYLPVATAAAEGVMAISVRVSVHNQVGQFGPAGPWETVHFVYSADPDGADAQQWAALLAAYEEVRTDAVREFRDSLRSARAARQRQLSDAAEEHNQLFRDSQHAAAADMNAAHEQFFHAAADIEQRYQQALQDAAARLAARATELPPAPAALPAFAWPAAPLDGRLPLPLESQYAPAGLPATTSRVPASFQPLHDAPYKTSWINAETQKRSEQNAAAEELEAKLQRIDEQLQQKLNAIQNRYSARVRAAEQQYQDELAKQNPQLDLQLSLFRYYLAVQVAENTYQASRKQHQLDADKKIAAAKVVWTRDYDAAQAAYEREMSQANQTSGSGGTTTQPSPTPTANTPAQAYRNRAKALAAADRKLADATARASHDRRKRDTDALAIKQRAESSAHRQLVTDQLNWDHWDRLRHITAWEAYATELNAAQIEADDATATAVRDAEVAKAAAQRAASSRRTNAIHQQGQQTRDALNESLEEQSAALPALPEIALGRQLARHSTASDTAIAEEQAEHADQISAADEQRQRGKAAAQHQYQLRVSVARGRAAQDRIAAEVQRWRDVVAAAYIESLAGIRDEHAYELQQIQAATQYAQDEIRASQTSALKKTPIHEQYKIELAEIHLRYLGNSDDPGRQSAEQQALKRTNQLLARVDSVYQHAKVTALGKRADHEMRELLSMQKAAHHAAEQRAQGVAAAEAAYATAIEQAKQAFLVAVVKAGGQHDVASGRAAAQFEKDKADSDAQLAVDIATHTANRLQVDEQARSLFAIERAQDWASFVSNWASAPGIPLPWKLLHVAYAAANVDFVRGERARIEQFVVDWTTASLQQISDQSAQDQQVVSRDAGAAKQLTQSVADEQDVFAAAHQQAFVMATADSATATQQYDSGLAGSDRVYLDDDASAAHSHDKSIRDAYWKYRHKVIDADLELTLETITPEEHARRVRDARKILSKAEGAAHVQYVQAVTSTTQVWQQQVGGLQVLWTGELARAAADRITAVSAAQLAYHGAELQATRLAIDAAEAAAAWRDQQRAHSGGQFNHSISQATGRHYQSAARSSDTLETVRKAIQDQFHIDVQADHAASKHTAWQRLQSGAQSTDVASGSLTADLLQYQAAIADADMQHAQAVGSANGNLQRAADSANQLLVAAWNTADGNWTTARSAADAEFVGRVSSAMLARGMQMRDASATHSQELAQAEQQFEQAAAAAHAAYEVAVARSETTFQMAFGTARGKRLVAVARAQADLHAAGEEPPDPSRSADSYSIAQQAYTSALAAADVAYRQDLQKAVAQRAGDIGDAIVHRTSAVGSRALSRAGDINQSATQFIAVDNGSSVAYAVAVSEAVRRHTEKLTDAEATRDSQLAAAESAWIRELGNADTQHASQLAQASTALARTAAQAEANYQAAQAFGPVLHDWIVSVTPDYVQYREQTASLAGLYHRQQVRAGADLAERYAVNQENLVNSTGTQQLSFAARQIGALNTQYLQTVGADNLLMAQTTFADGQLNSAGAQAVMDYETALAAALKQYAVERTSSSPIVAGSAEHNLKIAAAAAARDFEIDTATADYRWTTDQITAEQVHTQLVIQAANGLDRAVGEHRADLTSALANLVDRSNQQDAAALVNYAMTTTSERQQWQLAAAVADQQWQGAQYGAAARIVEQLAAVEPDSWTEYQALRAAAVDQWWSVYGDQRLDTIRSTHVLERQMTADLGNAYETLVQSVSAADRDQRMDSAQAQYRQHVANVDARENFGLRLVTPAGTLDQQLAIADRDYLIDAAQANFEWAESGDSEQLADHLLRAAGDRGRRIAGARAAYELQVDLATAHRSQDEADAINQFWLAKSHIDQRHDARVVLAGAKWQQQVELAMADFAAGQSALAAANEAEQAASWAAAFSELVAAENDSPWAEYQLSRAAAERDRSAARHALEEERSGTLHQIRRELADGRLDLWQREVDVQIESSDLQQASISAALAQLSRLQRDSTNQLAISKVNPPATVWPKGAGEAAEWATPAATGQPASSHDLVRGAHSLLLSPLAGLGGVLGLLFAEGPNNNSIQQPAGGGEKSGRVYDPTSVHHYPHQPGPEMNSIIANDLRRSQAMFGEPTGVNGQRGTFERLFEDIGLMAQHPVAATYGSLDGLATSGKVLVNGTASTLKSTLTLGFASDPVELIAVTENDIANGYRASFAIMRVSQEIGLSAFLAKFTDPSQVSKLTRLGRALFYWDMAQNASSAGRGSYGVFFGEGWTLTNGVDMAGGVLGLSAGSLTPLKHLIDGPIRNTNEALDATITLGAKISSVKDRIGHAFVSIEFPDRTSITRGFYPDDLRKADNDFFRFFFAKEGGIPGRLIDDADLLNKPTVLLKRFRITSAEAQRALNFIHDFEKNVAALGTRYYIGSQCATFAKAVLRQAGVKPFIPVAYPPALYFTLWLRKFL